MVSELTCRACLCKGAQMNFANIFTGSVEEKIIADMLGSLASIELSENDALPKVICTCCLQRLKDYAKFKELVLTSDFQLRQVTLKTDNETQEICENLKLVDQELDLNNDDVKSKKTESFGDSTYPNHESEDSEMLPFQIQSEINIEDITNVIATTKEARQQKLSRKFKKLHCRECNESFRSQRSYIFHKIRNHRRTSCVCEICNKNFPNTSALRLHQRKHSELKQYECKVCGKSFRFPSVLMIHTKMHIGIGYKCSKCDKHFIRLQALEAHQAVHAKEKFVCEICSKNFHTISGLSQHLRIHCSGTVPCPTCGDCNGGLSRRIRVHSREGSFQCDNVCNKTFTEKRNLKVQSHSEFACDICFKKFRHAAVAKLHKRVHVGETAFACTFCHKKFRYQHHFHKHMEDDHSTNNCNEDETNSI